MTNRNKQMLLLVILLSIFLIGCSFDTSDQDYPSNINYKKYTVEVYNSGGSFSGSVGSGGNSYSVDGYRTGTYDVVGWPAVAVIQKKGGYGELLVKIKDYSGKVIATSCTDASYGIVTLSSAGEDLAYNCNAVDKMMALEGAKIKEEAEAKEVERQRIIKVTEDLRRFLDSCEKEYLKDKVQNKVIERQASKECVRKFSKEYTSYEGDCFKGPFSLEYDECAINGDCSKDCVIGVALAKKDPEICRRSLFDDYERECLKILMESEVK